MNNPNAFAAALAGALSIGVQWLVQRYAHVGLAAYWKDTITAAFAAGVLYVGNDGIKAALVRLWNGPKKIWAGSSAPAAEAKPSK